MLLIDANLPPDLAKDLAPCFPGTHHVESVGLYYAEDEDIREYAQKNKNAVLTQDWDFMRLIDMRGAPPKVIRVSGKFGRNEITAYMSANADFIKNWLKKPDSTGLVLKPGYAPREYEMVSKPKLLVDDSLPSSLVRSLQTFFPETRFVKDVNLNAFSDDHVCDWATQNGFVLLTCRAGTCRKAETYSGLKVIRIPNTRLTPKEILQRFDDNLRAIWGFLKGNAASLNLPGLQKSASASPRKRRKQPGSGFHY